MTGTESELLDRALAGDPGAFTALYRRRQGSLYRFALQMTGSAAVAEDITQEAFLALLTRGHLYDPARGSVAAYLYGIARNLLRQRYNREHCQEADVTIEEFPSSEDVLDDLTRRETVERVRRAVLSLPQPYREAVVLCDLGDASYEEAAAALECPLGTVRSRLSRARAMLAQKLAPERGVCHV